MSDRPACEMRCPIHGFIPLNEWERRIVDHPSFQRLRRIRQLAWTDLVYPGAEHNRFEHSLGVMHVATLLYDSIVRNSSPVLMEHFRYTRAGLERDRQKVRLAALLHDVGHSPFSHASEILFPIRQEELDQTALFPDESANQLRKLEKGAGKAPSKNFEHEDYSWAIILDLMHDAIDNDEFNKRNYGIKADEVAAILMSSPEAGPSLFWKDLLSNQLDADRMDYLLRDSHHIGVTYGHYDLNRIVSTIVAFKEDQREEKTPRIGIYSGGWNAAEALIIARYSMFKQVYLHKTRLAYDIHIRGVMKELLDGGHFPLPFGSDLREYVKWDDWRVLGKLANGEGGEHAERLLKRRHYRLVYSTKDFPKDLEEWTREEEQLKDVQDALSGIFTETETPKNSWYSTESADIPVISESDPSQVRPLSDYSLLLKKFTAKKPTLIFVRPEDAVQAKKLVKEITSIHSAKKEKGADRKPQSSAVVPPKGREEKPSVS